MKLFFYLLLIAALFVLLYLGGLVFDGHKPAIISDEVTNPDLYLSNTKSYYQEHAVDRSIMQLEKAIEAIEEIEQDIDDDSKRIIDTALGDIRRVKAKMQEGDIDVETLNKVSIEALNALTYAEIKVTEHFVESHEQEEARIALKYGLIHMKNALNFSKGKTREYEIQIYNDIDSLLDNEELKNEEIITRLEQMLRDIELQNKDLHLKEQ